MADRLVIDHVLFNCKKKKKNEGIYINKVMYIPVFVVHSFNDISDDHFLSYPFL